MNEQQLRWSGLKVGIVVLIGMVIFVFVVSIVGTEQNLFTSNYELKLFMPNVRGLVSGAMVSLGGLKVGYVTGMDFTRRNDTMGVDVTMRILEKYSGSITTSTVAQIKTIGLLGDRYVDLSIGREGEAALAPGSLVPLMETFDLEAAGPTLNRTLQDFSELVASSKQIAATINRGEGSVGRIVTKPDLARDLERFAASLNRITGSLEEAGLTRDLSAVAGNLREVTGRLREGKGTAGKLIMDESLYRSLASFGARADSLVAKAGADSSNLSKLLSDPEFYAKVSKLLHDLDLLLVDLKENPDRYVKVSVF